MNPIDRKFTEIVRENEPYAPGHDVLLDYATAIIEYGRYRVRLFLIAFALILATSFLPPLGAWVDWLIPLAVSITMIVLLNRRDKRITADFEAARDAYLHPPLTLAEQVNTKDANGISPKIPCTNANTDCRYQDPHHHGFACTDTCPCNKGGHS